MQFTSLLLAAAALVGVNAVNLTNTAYTVTAGQSFPISWAGASGPVTITLKNGPALALVTVSTITSGATSSPFSWNVPSSLPIGNYAIEISDGTDTNYSPEFGINGATATGSATASSSVSASASGSVSSSVSASVSSSLSASSASVASTSANKTSSASTSSVTGASNSTTSATGSSSAGKTTTAGSTATKSAGASSTSGVPNANSASEFASPLALVFLTFAAIFSLN